MDKYFGNNNKRLSDRFAKRTVQNSVSYIIPVLDSLPENFIFLDVGCGPASITLDIAQRYPNATILAIDQPEAIELARRNAAEAGVTNAQFAVGDGMQLAAMAQVPGFEAVLGGCDVVHTHQVHLHVQDSPALMKQLRLAAKPQGDMGMAAFWPVTPAIEAIISMFPKLLEVRGQDPNVGRKLQAHAITAGFKKENCYNSVETWLYDTVEKRREWVMVVSSSTVETLAASMAREKGSDLSQFKQDMLDWAESDDGYYALPCPQIVCRRDD
ncbi:hypothetical protein PT974_01934 [Cladobotryum mycophilum]|uniref:Methyltransferase domain-containing protein n=1 Tax=Cladobotryum mycophilum TaxID=491253 RepID=A0ABR0SWQ7_9HYPO